MELQTNSEFFVHITDLHLQAGQPRCWEALERFVRQVGLMSRPAFVLCTGDIVFASMKIESEPEDVEPDLHRYKEIMAGLGVPLYNALGNHDMTRSTASAGTGAYGKELFVEYCGPRYQSFDWSGLHCVVLDEWIVQPGPRLTSDIDREQLDWLRRDLSDCPPGQRVLVFTHHSVVDYPDAMNKLSGAVRRDLDFVEFSGCDHQNSVWRIDNWENHTTGSFCGGWWDGPCIDTSPPGYALIVRDEAVGLRHYYRGLDEPLAIALPRPGETIGDSVTVDAMDPTSGRARQYRVDAQDWPTGWNELEVRIEDKSQSVEVFRRPDEGAKLSTVSAEPAWVEFEVVEPPEEVLKIELNGVTIGCLSDGVRENSLHRFAVPPGGLGNWNCLSLVGAAVVGSPRILTGQGFIEDPRIERLESVRPAWFGEGRTLNWDTGMRRRKTPWRHSQDRFYFPLNRGG